MLPSSQSWPVTGRIFSPVRVARINTSPTLHAGAARRPDGFHVNHAISLLDHGSRSVSHPIQFTPPYLFKYAIMRPLLTLVVAILGSSITSVLATPNLKRSVLKTDTSLSGHAHLTGNGTSASASSGPGKPRTIQLAAANRFQNDHHAGYLIHSFVEDGFDYEGAGPLLTRNVSARYTIGGITSEPDTYVHGQISMNQQIQIGGDDGDVNTDGCNGNFLTLGTQMIVSV